MVSVSRCIRNPYAVVFVVWQQYVNRKPWYTWCLEGGQKGCCVFFIVGGLYQLNSSVVIFLFRPGENLYYALVLSNS